MPCGRQWKPTYLETLVLQNSLDGRIFSAGRELGLEHNTERAVADDFALCVLQFPRLSRQSILDLFAYDLYKTQLAHVLEPMVWGGRELLTTHS